MKKKKEHKIRIYQDSKELPFLNYKRIVQTGDFYYMVTGYEAGDEVDIEESLLKERFNEIEEDYVNSMNDKSHDLLLYGQHMVNVNEFNRYNIILQLIELTIRSTEIRDFHHFPASEDLNIDTIKDLLKDFKIQKVDDLYKQRQFVQDRIEKIKNQIAKLEAQTQKDDAEKEKFQFDIEEQFVSVCIVLEKPIDDTKISLYQYGFMVKAAIKKVEEINKMNSHAR